ncbi:hypothetical protein [Longimicrobium sp.]|uniref:hypothetical protein n=1 Tax=Longimicrobium sp. TaxID=2029185 RepID=UPI003B3A0041
MNYDINVAPDELARLVVQAAENAAAQGYWTGAAPIAQDALHHLTRFLGLLLAGDDDINRRELTVYSQALRGASGVDASHEDLRAAAMETMEMANDPDALHAFLGETPRYLRAIVAMDRERGTRNAGQVVTALSGLGVAMLTADGREAEEEDSIFTTHLNHLRGELDVHGVTTD